MVLIRAGLALGALASAACNHSLFDNHYGGGGGTDAGIGGGSDGSVVVPASCAAPCLADAAVDFDGTSHGASMRWRYLEDHRDRTWGLMTVGSTTPPVMTGQNALNRITTCKGTTGVAACDKLTDALLISSAGATAIGDPAIEFTVPTSTVIQIALRVFVPDGADQEIRLYRGSREDVLFTGVATAGTVLEQTITLDALSGDRFLLAVAPMAAGAMNVGVQLFAHPTGAPFPHDCQLALAFDGLSGSTAVNELCQGAGFESRLHDAVKNSDMPMPIALFQGPYDEEGMGVDLASGAFLQGTQLLDQLPDLTVQLWLLQRNQDTTDIAWPFSDLDVNNAGGLGIEVQPGAPPLLIATTSPAPMPPASAAFDAQGKWEFLRVVHAGDTLRVCINGKLVTTAAVPAGHLRTTLPPYIGKAASGPPVIPYFDGVIDDVRVLTGALPCTD